MTLATSHGCGRAAERLPADQFRQHFLARHLGQEGVHGQARRDRVDPDAVRGDVERGAPGERHHPGLGRRVVRLAGLRAPAEHRGVVHHRSPVPLRDHLPQRRPGAPEGAVERHVEHPQPLLVGHLEDRAGAAEPRVVNEHVDAAEPARRAVDQRVDRALVGDVARQRPDPVPVRGRELVAGLAQPPGVLVADHHLGALLEAAAGGGRADAGAGRGGDHDDLAVEQAVALGGSASSAVSRHPRTGLGRPSARAAMMLRWISSDPP